MTTHLSSGTIPAYYRQVFDACSHNGEPVHRDVYELLLSLCKLAPDQTNAIWQIAGPSQGSITRNNLYKTLALAAWAQQGRVVSEKLLENLGSQEYPVPNIDDLSPVKNLVVRLNIREDPSVLGLGYADIIDLDTVTLELVPEKKGLFLKYSEYFVTSKRFGSTVTRRYNDFVALQELLLARFPYRMVPGLPPKKIVSDARFLESRRRGLCRWLTLVVRHPTMSHDACVGHFLTDPAADGHRMRATYRRAPDEFATSDMAGDAARWTPARHDGTCLVVGDRDAALRTLTEVLARLKATSEAGNERDETAAGDWRMFGAQLRQLTDVNLNVWTDCRKNFANLSKQFEQLGDKVLLHSELERSNVTEKLALILDVLISHKDLCQRLEKGLTHDHQQALSKMLSLKKRKIQGAIRGTNVESVEQLEAKMLAQENLISNIELRSDFSFYCVHMETQLVHLYLETLGPIMSELVEGRTRSHSELAAIWRSLRQNVPSNDGHVTNGPI